MRDLIERHGIDFDPLGTHGRGGLVGMLLLGPVTEQLLRHAPCRVLMIGLDVLTSLLDHERFADILFATDFSDGSVTLCRTRYRWGRRTMPSLLIHVLERLEPLPTEYSKELLSDYPAACGSLFLMMPTCRRSHR